MKILFLDVDGVLNNHFFCPHAKCGQINSVMMGRLNYILAMTDASIVLTSAWRYICHRGESNLTGLEWLFRSHGLMAGRLVGYTSEDTLLPRPVSYDGNQEWVHTNERGQQIKLWLSCSSYDIQSYCVVDDLDLGIQEYKHPFVQTDGKVGLTDADAQKIVSILNKE